MSLRLIDKYTSENLAPYVILLIMILVVVNYFIISVNSYAKYNNRVQDALTLMNKLTHNTRAPEERQDKFVNYNGAFYTTSKEYKKPFVGAQDQILKNLNQLEGLYLIEDINKPDEYYYFKKKYCANDIELTLWEGGDRSYFKVNVLFDTRSICYNRQKI